MSLSPQQRFELITSRLQSAFLPNLLEVMDESKHHAGHPGAATGAGHYAINIVASQFSGLTLIKRHQLIYQQLNDLIPNEIHALKINARTPEEIKASL